VVRKTSGILQSCTKRSVEVRSPVMEPFKCDKPLIGMIHLLPLPGSPAAETGGLALTINRALRDLEALEAGGASAAIVENFGDAPFAKQAPRETVADMAILVNEIVKKARIPIGVNVLRNDGLAAIAIAAAAKAAFVRVNVFCGVAFTDQGMIEGNARELHELRNRLRSNVKIFADVQVKHAAHLTTIEEAALDTDRNNPDGLIVTGIGTGKRTPPERLQAVKQLTELPVLVGSGVRLDNLATYRDADGFIVGSSMHEGGSVRNPVDEERVRAMSDAIKGLRGA